VYWHVGFVLSCQYGFLLLQISFYVIFNMAVYVQNGALFFLVLLDLREHTSVRDLLFRISLLIFLKRHSGIAIAQPIHKMLGHIFVMGNWHIYSYYLLFSQYELTALYYILRTTSIVITWIHHHLLSSTFQLVLTESLIQIIPVA
jgi:hypothetical protein